MSVLVAPVSAVSG